MDFRMGPPTVQAKPNVASPAPAIKSGNTGMPGPTFGAPVPAAQTGLAGNFGGQNNGQAGAPVGTPAYVPPVNLVDPITSKRIKLQSPFNDRLLTLNGFQKLWFSIRNTVVVLPKTVMQGLRGDSAFTFSDFLHVAQIPYYLGGTILAASFAAGRGRLDFVRQGIGVGLYYLGVTAANKGIDAFYKLRYGVDLDRRFQKHNGDVEKVFASADFPRTDLLKEEDYHKMARRMNIPENVADPKREVNDQTKRIIIASRADKLILGNVLAAVGAGFVARSNAWGRLVNRRGTIKNIWSGPGAGSVGNRIANTALALRGILGPGIREKFTGYAGEANPWLRKSIWWSVAAVAATVFVHASAVRRKRPEYESPLLNSLSPELAMGSPTGEPVRKELSSQKLSVFSTFEQARADATLAGRSRR